MTGAKAVNEKFQPIPDDTSVEQLPDKFHILTGAVIYSALADEKAQEQIDEIIEQIGKGEWFVSMEALFRGFDYGITSATGEQKILPRTEETAWLTKHLRQYGGTGKYENFSLGRVLKNITFSGKGLVRMPANPESIILNENVTAFKSTLANLGYITSSSNDTLTESAMAENNDAQVQIKALEKRVAELADANQKLTETVKTHESSATTAKITGLEAELKTKGEKITQLEGELKTANEAKATVDKEVETLKTRAEKAEAEIAAAKAAERTRSRIESLTKIHAPEDEAKKIVALFEDKGDDEFKTLTSLFSDKWKPAEPAAATASTTEEKPAKPAKPAKTPVPADTDDFEEEEDAALAADTNPEVEATRAAMAEVFAQMLGDASYGTNDGEEL
jgi:DNA repair exonuclease SbcCD ATPase subunit